MKSIPVLVMLLSCLAPLAYASEAPALDPVVQTELQAVETPVAEAQPPAEGVPSASLRSSWNPWAPNPVFATARLGGSCTERWYRCLDGCTTNSCYNACHEALKRCMGCGNGGPCPITDTV